MKAIITILLFFVFLSAQSQNVGIGTSTPAARLSVNSSSGFGNPTILITDSMYKGFGNLRFQHIDYPGRFMQISGYKAQEPSSETFMYILSDSITNMTFRGNGMVGVNKAIPNERLDVDGNINLTGTIKANGVDGAPNQVLMKNISGSLAWGDINGSGTSADNGNVAIYFATTSGASQNWPVPAGVTRVTIELWGAGGAGSSDAGGGGGGYARGNFNVAPGKSISMVIGLGGAVADGQQTSVTVEGNTIIAFGGKKSISSYEDGNPIGEGGFYTVTGDPFRNYTGVPGESGHATIESTNQYSPTEFRKMRKVGNGGNAGNSSNTGGRGGQIIYLLPGGGTYDAVRAAKAQVPGGGGPAQTFPPESGAGAAGLVVIHY
jgi:hypothetical protein